jgi:hypothetical protein
MFNLRILKRLTNIIDFTSWNTGFVQNINPFGGRFRARNRSNRSIKRITVL